MFKHGSDTRACTGAYKTVQSFLLNLQYINVFRCSVTLSQQTFKIVTLIMTIQLNVVKDSYIYFPRIYSRKTAFHRSKHTQTNPKRFYVKHKGMFSVIKLFFLKKFLRQFIYLYWSTVRSV